MAGRTFCLGVLSLSVLSTHFVVAGFAIGDGFDLLFFEMARAAFHGHHGCRGVDLVAGDTVKGRPIACTVAKIAEDFDMLSLQGPWMPGLCTGRGGRPQRHEWTPLRHGMANRAGTG